MPEFIDGRGLPVGGGLVGAVAPARFVGGTASGAPSTGTFAVGDFAIDETGKIQICTVAGTPGTWVAAGGGGVSSSQVYVGKNAVGGTADNVPNVCIYLKKIVFAGTRLITNVDGHFALTLSGPFIQMVPVIYKDASGSPSDLLVIPSVPKQNLSAGDLGFEPTTTSARWLSLPLGVWVAAGTYWIGIAVISAGNGSQTQIHRDGSGTDVTIQSDANYGIPDASNVASHVTVTTTTNDYSIRISVIP